MHLIELVYLTNTGTSPLASPPTTVLCGVATAMVSSFEQSLNSTHGTYSLAVYRIQQEKEVIEAHRLTRPNQYKKRSEKR